MLFVSGQSFPTGVTLGKQESINLCSRSILRNCSVSLCFPPGKKAKSSSEVPFGGDMLCSYQEGTSSRFSILIPLNGGARL